VRKLRDNGQFDRLEAVSALANLARTAYRLALNTQSVIAELQVVEHARSGLVARSRTRLTERVSRRCSASLTFGGDGASIEGKALRGSMCLRHQSFAQAEGNLDSTEDPRSSTSARA
jgi:hypothetical protein